MPEEVVWEIQKKAHEDKRFQASGRILARLPPRLMNVLTGEFTREREIVYERLTEQPMAQRVPRQKDLGEIMAIVHGVVLARSGCDVTLIIDDGEGRRKALNERGLLEDARRVGDTAIGELRLIGTTDILQRAYEKGSFENKSELKKLYTRMRKLDDGLVPFEQSQLCGL